jgi:hypothetical protein
MTAPENFVARWSRLKRGSATDRETAPAESAPPDTVEPATFDPATLPPIESITSDTDIRAFLQSGVPARLTQAALRRAWTSDPAIRDFIGIAENQWNFTDPNGIPGFGPMRETDDVASLVAQALGTATRASEAVSAEDAPQTPDHRRGAVDARSRQPPDMLVAGSAPKSDETDAAEENGIERPRSHGSALPR